jgi:deoxyadenosine/deoxycytidine kinase
MKVSIEGNIGCGKSTLLSALKNVYEREVKDMYIFEEPLEEWNTALTKFYEDKQRWSFLNNTNVLLSYSAIKTLVDRLFSGKQSSEGMLITERSPWTCRRVFTELARDNGDMCDLEMSVFQRVFDQISWTPDVVVYLQMPPTTCLERIRVRGRTFEKEIGIRYLEELHEKHERLMDEFRGRDLCIFVIDATKPQDVVLKEVLDVIDVLRKTCAHKQS